MSAARLAQMLCVVNVFIGLASTTSPIRGANLVIGLMVAGALYLDRR